MGMNSARDSIQIASAEQLTAASGSNLALALRVLPQARRRDMRVFYAFCRIVDDLADEPDLPMDARRDGLRSWRKALQRTHVLPDEPPLADTIRRILRDHDVPFEWAVEVVVGCEMDLAGEPFLNWEQLRQYCFRVASAVGLVSARIFGGVGCEAYAEDLGLALQLTNILRDSAEDYRRDGRVYFPLDELNEFGVEPGAWASGRPSGWDALMAQQVARARGYYSAAVEKLPKSQQQRMVAAEIMREVYSELLDGMVADGLQVWERRYRLTRRRKLWLAGSVFARNFLQ
jgi:phytoene synthase